MSWNKRNVLIMSQIIVVCPVMNFGRVIEVSVVSTKEHLQIPNGTGPGVRRSRRSLLACHTRCKCSMETTHNSVKVKLGIKVMKNGGK